MTRSRRKLTEAEWQQVFAARCRSKEGRASQDDQDLCARAYRADPKRYAALTEPVFEATRPFGSTTRRAKGEAH